MSSDLLLGYRNAYCMCGWTPLRFTERKYNIYAHSKFYIISVFMFCVSERCHKSLKSRHCLSSYAEAESWSGGSRANSHLIKLYGDHLNIDLPCKLRLVAIIEYCTNQGNPPITITRLFDDHCHH